MKLVNEEGKFQLVKNNIVEIDNTLPKYKKLEILAKIKEKHDAEYRNSLINSINIIESETLPVSDNVDSDTAPLDGDNNVDQLVRDIIMGLKASNLRKFLSSPDAAEFNKEFLPILLAEEKGNRYSLAVTNNRWTSNSGSIYDYDTTLGVRPIKESSFYNKICKLYNNLVKAVDDVRKESADEKASSHIVEFFDIVHVEAGKEKEFIDKLSGFFKLIKNAALMHQDAQLDELCQGVVLHIYESVLSTHGFNKYVTFGEIEKIRCEGKRLVDIDYIKNFGRIIPDEIVEKKAFCDELCVFDNYCVMYYDPTGATYKVPSEAKRDPILFGLINHSDKLYYIGDWVDDKCDLTFDKIAEQCNISELD